MENQISSAVKMLFFTSLIICACTVSSIAQQVTVTLCEGLESSNDMNVAATAINPTNVFKENGSNDNVFFLLNFEPFGKSVGLRLIVTEKDKDGEFFQDRVMSVSSTSFYATASMVVHDPGKYCVRVVDEFDESIAYSKEVFFTLKK